MERKEMMIRIIAASQRSAKCYKAIAKKHGFSERELMVVGWIMEMGPMSPTKMANMMHLSRSTIQTVLDRFMKEGYMELVPEKGKKTKVLDFTEKGRKRAELAKADVDAMEERVLDDLGGSNAHRVVSLTERMAELIEKETKEQLK